MAYEEYTPKEISALIGLIDTYLRWNQYKQKDSRSYKHYHPSEWGYCLRVQQYKHYIEKGYISSEYESLDSKTLRLFDKGHNMHSRWVKYFDRIGNILLGKWKCTNQLCYVFTDEGKQKKLSVEELEDLYKSFKSRIYGEDTPIFRPEKCICGNTRFRYEEATVKDASLNMKGHADTIINCSNLNIDMFKDVDITFDKRFLPIGDKNVVIDFKTINDRNYVNQLERRKAHKGYKIQLTIYIHILGCEYGVLLYENKNNSETKYFVVPRNDKWWELIKKQATTMMDMASGSVHRLPPPRPLKMDCYECKKCDFRNLCKKSNIWDKKNLNSMRKDFYGELL